jgi:hypothetical protein
MDNEYMAIFLFVLISKIICQTIWNRVEMIPHNYKFAAVKLLVC